MQAARGVGFSTIANSTFDREESVRSYAYPAILLALAACAPTAASSGSPSPGARDADVPPVMSLLSERERLKLSSGQVEALESIAREWQATHDHLTREIGAVKGRGPSPVRLVLGKQARLASAAIAENNARTAQAVAGVLNPAQRQVLCTVQRLESIRMAKMRDDGEMSVIRRASTRHRDWPWCATPGTGAASAN